MIVPCVKLLQRVPHQSAISLEHLDQIAPELVYIGKGAPRL